MPLARVKKESVPSNNVAHASEIFYEHGDFIRAVIRYQVGNNAQADDLFQDFFLSLVSRPIPAEVQNIRSYLYRAIINDIVDAARRVEQYRIKLKKYAEFFDYSIRKNSPKNAIIDEEEMDKMFKLIEDRLRRGEVRAIHLRYKNGYNNEEVAKKMHVNIETVKRYLSEGLRRIRQFFK